MDAHTKREDLLILKSFLPAETLPADCTIKSQSSEPSRIEAVSKSFGGSGGSGSGSG